MRQLALRQHSTRVGKVVDNLVCIPAYLVMFPLFCAATVVGGVFTAFTVEIMYTSIPWPSSYSAAPHKKKGDGDI